MGDIALAGVGDSLTDAFSNWFRWKSVRQGEELLGVKKQANVLKLMQQKIDAKKTEKELGVLQLDRAKFMHSYMQEKYGGRNDITQHEMDADVNFFTKNLNMDISSQFIPNKNEQTGFTESYSFDTSKSRQDEFDNQIKKEETDIKKLEAVTERLKLSADDEVKTWPHKAIKILESDPKFKNASPEDQMKMLLEIPWKMPTASTITELESGTKRDIEADIYSSFKQIETLNQVGENYADTYLTWEGKWKAWGLDKLDKSVTLQKFFGKPTPEQKEFMEKYSVFKNAIGRMVFSVVHDISGAQYSVKELEKMMETMFNFQQGPTMFKASYNAFIDFLKKTNRMKNIALRSKLKGKALEAEVDRLMKLPADSSLTPMNINMRGAEIANRLRRDNPDLPMDQIVTMVDNQLKAEGY
jgi:hypothetical protein